jgi:hypothetical protein
MSGDDIQKTVLNVARAKILEILEKHGKPTGTVLINFRRDKDKVHLEIFEAAQAYTNDGLTEGKELWKGTL